MNVVCAIYYIVYVFWYASTDNACIYTFALYLVCYVICFGHVIHECGCLHFFKICRDFFRIVWGFYVTFCAYRSRPIRVAETDPSQCPPSRRPRPRLWTMRYMYSDYDPILLNSCISGYSWTLILLNLESLVFCLLCHALVACDCITLWFNNLHQDGEKLMGSDIFFMFMLAL